MARFRYYFFCLRSTTKGDAEGPRQVGKHGDDAAPQVGKHGDDGTQGVKADQPTKYAHRIGAGVINMSDPGRVLGHDVYKGLLDNRQQVAVKRFDERVDIIPEVRMLIRLQHSNLIKIIGYNDKGRFIILEYMPLKSLNLHLQDLKPSQKPLDWKTRMKIAQGVAKALEYLHDQNVIFGRLCSTCILLDESYNPKLTDFSCAKDGPIGNYTSMEHLMETKFAYIAPEIVKSARLTLKSDVFSFGVVLLELISGQKGFDENIRGSGKHTITSWAEPLIDIMKLEQIVDPLIERQYPYRALSEALSLVKKCLKEEAHHRPPIAEVVTTISMIASSQFDEEVQVITEVDPIAPPTMLGCAQAVA